MSPQDEDRVGLLVFLLACLAASYLGVFFARFVFGAQ